MGTSRISIFEQSENLRCYYLLQLIQKVFFSQGSVPWSANVGQRSWYLVITSPSDTLNIDR